MGKGHASNPFNNRCDELANPKPQTEKDLAVDEEQNRAIDPCLLQFYVNNFSLIFFLKRKIPCGTEGSLLFYALITGAYHGLATC